VHLIQILLPVYDNKESPFDHAEFMRVRKELTERFGGITAYFRSPATGLWKDNGGRTIHDEIVIYEVMVEQPDHSWWRFYKQELSVRFHQSQLVIRALQMEMF
jgi:hypothetical protein